MKRRIRIAAALNNYSAPSDVLTSADVKIWRAAAVDFQLALFDGKPASGTLSSPASIAELQSVTLTLRTMAANATEAPDPTVASSASDTTSTFDDTLVFADWTAGTAEHLTLSLTTAEMGIDAGSYWLTITALRTDGEKTVLAAGKITVKEASISDPGAPAAGETWVTVAEGDARYARLTGVNRYVAATGTAAENGDALLAAQTAAAAGDTIAVGPGNYLLSSPISKTGVHWSFAAGAVLESSARVISLAAGVSIKVTGAGKFVGRGEALQDSTVWIDDGATLDIEALDVLHDPATQTGFAAAIEPWGDLYARVRRIESTAYDALLMDGTVGTIHIECDTLKGHDNGVDYVNGTSQAKLYLRANRIEGGSRGDGTAVILGAGVAGYIRAAEIVPGVAGGPALKALNDTAAAFGPVRVSGRLRGHVVIQSIPDADKLILDGVAIETSAAASIVSLADINNASHSTVTLRGILAANAPLDGNVALAGGGIFAHNGDLEDATGQSLNPKRNIAASDPTANDDETVGYSTWSLWANSTSGEVWRCIDAVEAAAEWVKTSLTLDELGALATGNDAADVPYGATDVAAALDARPTETEAAALVREHTNPRAIAARMHFDRATSGGRGYFALGTKGAIATDDFALEMTVYVPADAITTTNGLGGLSSSNASANVNGALAAYIAATSGDLRIVRPGATSSDYIEKKITGFRATYSGQVIKLLLVRTAGDLLVYANGVLLATTETVSGTAPPAWSDSLASDYLVLGIFGAAHLWQGLLGAPRLYNRALSAPEIAALVANGPAFADVAGGSQVRLVDSTTRNGGFENWTTGVPDDWTVGSALSVSQETVDVDSGASSLALTGAGPLASSINNWLRPTDLELTPGMRYEVKLRAKRTSADAAHELFVGWGYDVKFATTNDGTWRDYTVVVEGPSANSAGTTTSRFTIGSTSGSTWLIDGVNLKPLGLILNPEVIRASAQLLDTGPNRIHGLLTPGVTPVGGQVAPLVGSIAATGFFLGDQALWHEDYWIKSIWCRPGPGTPNIVVRRNSATGTIIVASETTGAEGAWKTLTIAAGSRDGASGDSIHIDLSVADTVAIYIEWEPR